MKKFLIIIVICLVLLFGIYSFLPYKIKTVCFGDVCPDNGGTYVLYKKMYSKEECVSIGGQPIIGFGWSEVYAGCSPNNWLSKLIQKN